VANGNITIDVGGDTAAFLDPPALLNLDGGGTGELTLDLFAEFFDNSESIILTLSFDHVGGVSNVQFSIFDVDEDFATPFTDRIRITATDGTNTFNPSSLTTSLCNTQINATTVEGFNDCASPGNAADGNVDIVFSQSGITSITVIYDNVETQPFAPGQQAITLHDITFTNDVAELSIVKTDGPTATEYTPGEAFQYTLTVTNNGPDDVTNALVTDLLPGWAVGATWTCSTPGGSTGVCGTTSGSGDLVNQAIASLPNGQTVEYVISGTYSTDMSVYP